MHVKRLNYSMGGVTGAPAVEPSDMPLLHGCSPNTRMTLPSRLPLNSNDDDDDVYKQRSLK